MASREGCDVYSVRDSSKSSPDEVVLQRALIERRVVITADKDFGELVFRLGLKSAGIILLRIDSRGPKDVIEIISRFWPEIRSVAKDHFLIVSNDRLRVRELPDL